MTEIHRDRAQRLVIYLWLVALAIIVIASFQYFDHRAQLKYKNFQRDVVTNCMTNRQNTMNLNHLIDTVIQRVSTAKDLSQADREKFVGLYTSARGKVPTCPPTP